MINASGLPVIAGCGAAGISRSSYYRNNTLMPFAGFDAPLKAEIESIALEFHRYGYRRVTKELHRRGLPVNHKKVLRIMHDENWLCKTKKFRVITTDSNHDLPVFPNLAKGLEVTRLNQLWVADITYIHLMHECVYLAAILDVFSRRCIGWHLARNMDTVLAMEALEMAIDTRQHLGFEGLIHHSDRGVQYASHEYVNRLSELDISISMSRKGNPYDNAFMESFNKTLKVEEVYIKEYKTLEEAYENIGGFIEKVYNKKRLHSSIGYRPPEEFETEVLNTKKFVN